MGDSDANDDDSDNWTFDYARYSLLNKCAGFRLFAKTFLHRI